MRVCSPENTVRGSQMARLKTSGGVEKRANSLRITFKFEGEWCKETVRLNGAALAPSAANFNYATRLAKQIDTDIRAGTFDYATTFPDSKRALKARSTQQAIDASLPASELPKNSFGALADLWLLSKGKLEGATKAQYGSAVNCWKRIFGARTPLAELDAKTVAVKVGAHPWPSPKTHNNYMIALRGIFALEYRGARSAENPCEGIENMPVVKTMPDPLTAQERDLILADLREHYDPRVYAYFLWQFFTGMRPEETIALRWSDIDWRSKTVRVQRVRTFRGSERDGSKTHAEREVELTTHALHALTILKPYTYMKRSERKKDADTAREIFERPEWVPGEKGGKPSEAGPWHDERSQRDVYWKPALKRIGVRYRTAYATRHTFCTVALMAGIPPAYIAQQAGHSVKMLLDKYARWIPGADGGAIRGAMEAAMTGSISPQFPQPRGKTIVSF